MNIVLNVYKVILILYCVYFIGLILYLYFNNVKPYPCEKLKNYIKEPPSKLNPIELSFLVYNKLTPQVLSATLCYLVTIGYLTKTKEKDEVYLYRNFKFKGKISHSQKYAVELVIDIIGNGEMVSFTQIKTFCNDTKKATTFLLNYEIWKRIATGEGSHKQFFEAKKGLKTVKKFSIFGLILISVNLLFGIHSILGYFIIIPISLVPYYYIKTFKRTKKYNNEFYGWLEFSNYLKNIKLLGFDKENINLYLIYSIILDKIGFVESALSDDKDFTVLNNNIIRCYRRSYFHGSRNI